MISLISCDAVLNRSKIPVPRGTSILLLFLVKIRPNLAKIHEDRTKTASQLINELTSAQHRSYLQDLCEHLEVRLAISVGKVPGRQLHQRDPQAPDVRADVVVRLRRVRRVDPLRRHVGSASGGPGLGLEEYCISEFPAAHKFREGYLIL